MTYAPAALAPFRSPRGSGQRELRLPAKPRPSDQPFHRSAGASGEYSTLFFVPCHFFHMYDIDGSENISYVRNISKG